MLRGLWRKQGDAASRFGFVFWLCDTHVRRRLAGLHPDRVEAGEKMRRAMPRQSGGLALTNRSPVLPLEMQLVPAQPLL